MKERKREEEMEVAEAEAAVGKDMRGEVEIERGLAREDSW